VARRLIVVGGGVIGLAAAAMALRRSSEASVTVLEKTKVGSGASAYAGTIDSPYCNTERHRPLVEASWAWHDACPGAAEYRRPIPITWYAEPGGALNVLPPLSPREASEWPAPDGVESYGGQAFVIDSPAWCRALAREIERSRRGRIVEGAEVVAVDPVRCADGKVYEADRVVVCVGPWLPGWTGPWRDLRTKRVAGLNVEILSDRRPQQAVAWPSRDLHFHPAFDGGASGAEYRMSFRHPVWDVDPDEPGTIEGADLDPVHRFLDRLLGAGRWSISGHRVFADTYTPDFTPVVEPCPALGRNVTAVTGTHGSGVRLAPGIADLVAREVLA
jgi:glycine/D-amino acid oxidase-like deaminating enzyme